MLWYSIVLWLLPDFSLSYTQPFLPLFRTEIPKWDLREITRCGFSMARSLNQRGKQAYTRQQETRAVVRVGA